MGLHESERIGKIVVDSGDSNVVYVCALGKLWSDGDERDLCSEQPTAARPGRRS